MIAFLDTSVLARRYLPETGSDAVRQLFRGRRPIAASRLAFAELCAATARACREGIIDETQRDEIIARLPKDFEKLSIIVEARNPVVLRVARLVTVHPLRAYDAMQLASCLELKARGAATELWSADGELSIAAQREGVKTVVLG